jgi:AraC-like DNA-binding protein
MERNYHGFYATIDNNSMFLGEDMHPHQRQFFEHTHIHAELFVFLQGCAEMVVEGNAIPLQENDVLVIPKGVRHYIRILKGAPYARVCMHVHEQLLCDLALQDLATITNGERVYTANLTDTAFIQTLPTVSQTAVRMISETAQRALFHERLLSLYHSLPPLQEKQSEPVRLLDKARFYIEANLEKELSLEVLAENLFVSPAYLCKVFRKKMGVPVMHFVNERRIRKAKQLILDGTPLKEVYLSCGYENYVTFFRVFLKQTGQTPSEFRQQH